MKIISIVGTRPQFIKLCLISEKIKQTNIEHHVINTGQHYDKEMSDDVFKVLNIKKPEYNLSRVGLTSTQIISNMMVEIEKIFEKENPDKVIVFGDCDTTLAGALVAKKNGIFLIHIEAGMRSYNKQMPEEINRILVDNISNMLLCSTHDSIEKLNNENLNNNIHYVGNIHLELLNKCINEKIIKFQEYNDLKLQNQNFAVLTIHRNYNTNPESLKNLIKEISEVKYKVIFLIHPRTKNIINNNQIDIPKNIILHKPLDYLNLIGLIQKSSFVLTDSGGLQSECWFLKKKCIILRPETEWIEPIKLFNNILYSSTDGNLNNFIINFLDKKVIEKKFDLNVTDNIIKLLI
jgi:UDP-GlcNAc3NAcA epimerase